ncbi:MAG: hypothetical protein QGI09_05245 [Dehalococcoidia bacterium]|nr:hypothetical protein [Dehalococcoidia bacterium]
MARDREALRRQLQERMENQARVCPNEDCPVYGQTGAHIVKNGRTRQRQQRYRCNECRRIFTATEGTPFYGLHTDWVDVLEALAMLAERNSMAAVARVKQVHPNTVALWLKKVGPYAQAVEEVLVQELGVDQLQVDELWTYVGNRGGKGGILRPTRRALFGRRPPSIR